MTDGLARLGLVRSSEQVTAPAPAGAIPPPRRAAASDPRALDVVYRALQLIETNVKQLSLDVWRGSQLLDRKEVPSILRDPDLEGDQASFNAETVQSLAQRGNAFWRLHRTGPHASDIIRVELLDPLSVHAWRDTGKTRYTVNGKAIPASDMLHLKLTHQPGEALGLGPIQACTGLFESALSLRHFADTWTQQPGSQPGFLKTDQVLSQAQADQWKQQANQQFTKQAGISVLGQGLTYQPLALKPSELQYLESQQADSVKLARLFGLTPRQALISLDGNSQTYANLESENLDFVRNTLMAYLSEIERAYTRLAPHGQHARFNLDALLRPDTAARYAAHKTGIDAGFLTVDEVRDIEGLPVLKENANDTV